MNQPPYSNTGVTGKTFAYSIDWLTMSCASRSCEWSYVVEPTRIEPVVKQVIVARDGVYKTVEYMEPGFDIGVKFPFGMTPAHHAFYYSGETLRPFPRYIGAAGLMAGRVDWAEDPQGVLISMTGQDCQFAHSQGVDWLDVLSHTLYWLKGNIARLDFAVDVFIPADVKDIADAWDQGRVKTTAKSYEHRRPRSNGGEILKDTMYIGSLASPKMARIYDKALSEGVPGPWVRIELQTKGKAAVALAKSMLIAGDVISAGKAFLADFLSVEGVDWFTAAVTGSEHEYLEPIERKPTNKQRWYLEQVMPALASDLSSGGVLGAWLWFQLHGLLDDFTEDGIFNDARLEHGGVVSKIDNSRKMRGAMKVLARHGLESPMFRRAFEHVDKKILIGLVQSLGYKWDTRGQKWTK